MECILAFVPSLFLTFSLLSWHVRDAMRQHRRQCRLAALALAPPGEDEAELVLPAPQQDADADEEDIDGGHSIDSGLAIPAPLPAADVDIPPLAPMQPPVFPIACPNPLFHMNDLRVQWSTDAFAKDTEKQQKLAAAYMKALRAQPNLGYFPSAGHVPEQASIAATKTNTPIFGAGPADKGRYCKRKRNSDGTQEGAYDADVEHLANVRAGKDVTHM